MDDHPNRALAARTPGTLGRACRATYATLVFLSERHEARPGDGSRVRQISISAACG
jgi:hypothetical protein